jgi:LysM repeat protein
MRNHLTRRELILAGAAALLAGCVQRGGQEADAGGLWYEVAEGDTLTSISRRFGVPVNLIADRNLLTSARLQPGTKLWLPGAATQGAPPTAVNERVENEPEPHDIPIAPPGGYVLVPRSAWTNRPVGKNHYAMDGVTRLTVHHTAENEEINGISDLELIRRVENYHRTGRHWPAIGYHYIVGRDARIYEGRPARYQGSHVRSENAHNLGIAVVGDFQSHLPTDRQLAALSSFLDDMRARYQVPKSRVWGHRDLSKSICPGDALYGWLQRYKNL